MGRITLRNLPTNDILKNAIGVSYETTVFLNSIITFKANESQHCDQSN